MSFISDTTGAISKLIQEDSSIEGECLHRLSAEEHEEQHKHSGLRPLQRNTYRHLLNCLTLLCRHSALGCVTLPQEMKQTVTPLTWVCKRPSSLQPVLLQEIAGWEANQTDLKHGVLHTWSLRRAQLAGRSPQNFNTLLEWRFLHECANCVSMTKDI